MQQSNKRRLSALGSSMYDSATSSNRITQDTDGSIKYDTNISASISNDNGVTAIGAHGRYAIFSDVRNQPLVGDTEDYELSIVRGSIITNNIPLFSPKPSSLITENGVKYWEVTAEPGLALTWTGPVYAADNVSGVTVATDRAYMSWPYSGAIPYYTAPTLPAAGTPPPRVSGWLDLSTVGGSADVGAVNGAGRLQTLLSNAGLSVTVSASASSAAMTQKLTFTNASTTTSVYLDFSLPGSYGQLNGANATHPSKAGILQACKLLGFIPGTVFEIPPGSVATAAPRAYQLGFRTTLNLFSYKTVRWVPEDQGAPFPTATDVSNGTTSTYFNCYSYQHFLNQCINPTFQRLIYDEFDASVNIAQQCLLRQLQLACRVNCSAAPWSPTATYAVGAAVQAAGRAYCCIAPNTGVQVSNTIYWLDCGTCINSTYSGIKYYSGDVVTYPNSAAANAIYLWICNSTTTTTPGIDATWSAVTALQTVSPSPAYNVTPNVPAIGTAAPTVTFNSATQLFTLNLDSYGYGGTQPTNVDDGYGSFYDDQLYPQSAAQQLYNATLNDQARDSWGLTGVPAVTTPAYTIFRHPFAVYDEKFAVECDDYFHQLFGNWPAQRLMYTDPAPSLVTSYIRYIPQAVNAGLTTPTVLPLVSPTVASTPYARVAGNQPYIYTFAQDYPSCGLLWNPVDTIVITTTNVPVEDDYLAPPYIIKDSGIPTTTKPNGDRVKILGEFVVKPLNNYGGQEYRNSIKFEPQTRVSIPLKAGQVFDKFDYQVFIRMCGSQTLVPVSLSNGGSVNIRFSLDRV
jgi:hypothetical protein